VHHPLVHRSHGNRHIEENHDNDGDAEKHDGEGIREAAADGSSSGRRGMEVLVVAWEVQFLHENPKRADGLQHLDCQDSNLPKLLAGQAVAVLDRTAAQGLSTGVEVVRIVRDTVEHMLPRERMPPRSLQR